MTQIVEITPRGGIPGDTIVISGTQFGPLEGFITVDGQTVTQVISWSDISITCVVPTGVQRDGNYILRVTRQDLADFDEEQFWIPAIDPFTADLDYQLPNSETGPTQNVDLPRRAEAALFNRLIDQIRASGGGGPATITVSSDSPGGPNEVTVSEVRHLRFITQSVPGEDHFVISRPNGEVYIGGSAAPDALAALTYTLLTYTGRLSDGNINYGVDPAGSSVNYITRSTSLVLTTANPASAFGFASLGNLILEINGVDVANIDLDINFSEANRSLGQVIANYNTQGTGDPVVAGVVTFTGGTLALTFVGPTSGIDTDEYQRGNATITLSASAMRQGYNYVVLRHEHGPIAQTTAVEWFLDTDPAGAPNDPDIGSTTLLEDVPVYKYLSGVGYYDVGSTFLVNTVGNDLFNNVYHDSEAPLTVSGFPGISTAGILITDPSVSGLSTPPLISEVMTVTGLVITVVSGQQANDAKVTVTPRDPYGSYTPGVSASSNFTIMSAPSSSTPTEEFFQDEDYRLPSTTDFNTAIGPLTGHWDSTVSLLDSSRLGELQVYDHTDLLTKNQLIHPTFNYTTGFNPVGPNYSSLLPSLDLHYIRAFQATVDKSNGIISVPGLTDVDIDSGLASSVRIDIKVPTKTVWLSLNKAFTLSTFASGANIVGGADGEGCRINSGVYSPNINGQIQFTLGTFFTGAAENRIVYVRVTYEHSAVPRVINGSGAGFSVVDW